MELDPKIIPTQREKRIAIAYRYYWRDGFNYHSENECWDNFIHSDIYSWIPKNQIITSKEEIFNKVKELQEKFKDKENSEELFALELTNWIVNNRLI